MYSFDLLIPVYQHVFWNEMSNILLLLLIISCTCVIKVVNFNISDLYQEPVFYDWNDQAAVVNDVTKLRRYENFYRNTDSNNVNIKHDETNKRKVDKAVKKTDDVKHFLKGAVNKVWSWFGKKTETDNSVGIEPSGSTGVADIRVIGDILKGIHRIFKKPVPKVVRREIRSTPVSRRLVTAKPLARGWVDAEFGIIPSNAFIAGFGYDGTEVYVAKGAINGTTTVSAGTLVAGKRCVRVPEGAWSRCVFKYQILIGNSYVWYPSYYNRDHWELHPQALIGGQESTKKGLMTNYICRAYHRMNLRIGKLHVDKADNEFRKCIIPYFGRTHTKISYDILIDWWE